MSGSTSLDRLLTESARRSADRPALTLGDRSLSYRELSAAVDQLATRLGPDVAPGQRVAIVAPNVPAFVIALFATWRLGGVAVPLSARSRERELRQILTATEPSVIVSVSETGGYSFASLFRTLSRELPTLRRCLFVDRWGAIAAATFRERPDLAPPPAPFDPAIAAILFTSGTTGEQKGVLVPHQRELDTAAALNDVLSATMADTCLFVVPLSHAFGLSCLMAAVAAASQAVLIESSLTPAPMTRAVVEHGATMLHGSPALFAALHKTGAVRDTTLRTGFVAGAVCPPALLSALDPHLPLLNLYGATEVGAATCCRLDDPPARRFSTVGRPLPGYEVRTVDAEIQVRCRSCLPGYLRSSGQPDAFADGWFRTGDLGDLDADGYLAITGRIKESIQVGGFTVSPAEVEGLLLTHPDVERAVVVGVPHEAMGEALRAVVVARPGANLTPGSLLQFARARIAGYKVPYAITLVPEIPTLASGKPDRQAVAQSILETADAARWPETLHGL